MSEETIKLTRTLVEKFTYLGIELTEDTPDGKECDRQAAFDRLVMGRFSKKTVLPPVERVRICATCWQVLKDELILLAADMVTAQEAMDRLYNLMHDEAKG